MKSLEEITQSLISYKQNIKIEKQTNNKFFVNTGLFFINTGNILPIYLVNYNGKNYFADYGGTFENLNVEFNKLNLKLKSLIKTKLSDLEVVFDGKTLLMEVIDNYEMGCLNIIICAMMFLQTII